MIAPLSRFVSLFARRISLIALGALVAFVAILSAPELVYSWEPFAREVAIPMARAFLYAAMAATALGILYAVATRYLKAHAEWTMVGETARAGFAFAVAAFVCLGISGTSRALPILFATYSGYTGNGRGGPYSTVPTCQDQYRGRVFSFYRPAANDGTKTDFPYLCVYDSAGTYNWVPIAPAQGTNGSMAAHW
jgi:hypothetical protein